MSIWKKEVARDLLALGSIPFYILVIARSLIGEYYLFTYQLLISILLFFLIGIFFKEFNQHLSRAIVLIVFTIIFYNQLIYTVFAILAGISVLVSLFYLKKTNKEIIFGLIFGSVVSLISYYLAPLI
jgi:hypothetical protein|tara:strand:+ start:1585 stop:1965 length:381 start_codon:yes stop_codon:yes gene_type:complete